MSSLARTVRNLILEKGRKEGRASTNRMLTHCLIQREEKTELIITMFSMHIDNFVSGYNKFRIISHGLINELLYCSSFDFHPTFLIRQNQSSLKAPTIAYFEQNKYLIYILFFLRSRIKLTFRTVSVCEA